MLKNMLTNVPDFQHHPKCIIIYLKTEASANYVLGSVEKG